MYLGSCQGCTLSSCQDCSSHPPSLASRGRCAGHRAAPRRAPSQRAAKLRLCIQGARHARTWRCVCGAPLASSCRIIISMHSDSLSSGWSLHVALAPCTVASGAVCSRWGAEVCCLAPDCIVKEALSWHAQPYVRTFDNHTPSPCFDCEGMLTWPG